MNGSTINVSTRQCDPGTCCETAFCTAETAQDDFRGNRVASKPVNRRDLLAHEFL
jgi:hypothetical protein